MTCSFWCWQHPPNWMLSCMQGMRPWMGMARVPRSSASGDLLLLSAAMASRPAPTDSGACHVFGEHPGPATTYSPRS
jgi:hypothetical protein